MSSDRRLREARLRMAFELYDFGVAVMRQNIKRAFPTAADSEINRRLLEWLEHRPGAELGDGEGVIAHRFGSAPR